MPDPLSVVGLLGLFTVCLEGYKLWLTAKGADGDFAVLQARMLLERERFVNVCASFGLREPGGDGRASTPTLRQYLEDDAFRRRAVAQTLNAVAMLIGKAEEVDRKYSSWDEVPDGAKEKKNPVQDSLDNGLRALRQSFNKVVTWPVRDKAAYEDVLKHLQGFNDDLERLHSRAIQRFLGTALPATVCASTDEANIPPLEQVASASVGHAFLASQIQWKSAVSGVGGVESATKKDAKSMKISKEQAEKGNADRYLALDLSSSDPSLVLVDWLPWMKPNSDIADRVSRTSTLLRLPPSQCAELCLLPCAGYLEEADQRRLGSSPPKARYALAYRLPAPLFAEMQLDPARYRTLSLRQLLLATAKQNLQLPLLETRLDLARSLCRAMLLYHSSGWVHHDFRSHNVLFTQGSQLVGDGDSDREGVVYDRVRIDKPYIIGFGHARDEVDLSFTFADPKSISQTLKQQRLYWSPSYLASSGQMRRAASFQRSHDVYSLGCVMLEVGVWKSLEAYTWHSKYDRDHSEWHKRLLQELPKLGVMCGSRYTEAVKSCLEYGSGKSTDIRAEVQNLAFDILLSLEEITV